MKFVFTATMTVLVLTPFLTSPAEAVAKSFEDRLSRNSQRPSGEWLPRSLTESRGILTPSSTPQKAPQLLSDSKKVPVYAETVVTEDSRGEGVPDVRTEFLRNPLAPTPKLMEMSPLDAEFSVSPDHQPQFIHGRRKGGKMNDSMTEMQVEEDLSALEESSKETEFVLKGKRKEEAAEGFAKKSRTISQDEAKGGEHFGDFQVESSKFLEETSRSDNPKGNGRRPSAASTTQHNTPPPSTTSSLFPYQSFPSERTPMDSLSKESKTTFDLKGTESRNLNSYDPGGDLAAGVINRDFKDSELDNIFEEQRKVFFGEDEAMDADAEDTKNVIEPSEGTEYDYEGESDEFLTFLIWGSSVKNAPSMSLRKMMDRGPMKTPWSTSFPPQNLLNATRYSHQKSELSGNDVNLIINRNSLAKALKYDKPISSSHQQIKQTSDTGENVNKAPTRSININISLNQYVNGSVIDLNRTRPGRSSGRSSVVRLDTGGLVRIPCYVVIFLLGMVGNTLVIITLLQNRKMRTVTNVFLLNLAIADLLLGVFCMPFTLVGSLLRDFIFGDVMCRIIPYFQAVSVSVSVWTLVAISFERYYAICQPLRSRGWQTLSHAYKIITLVWLLSLAMMCPTAALSQLMPIGNTGRHKCREVWPSLTLERLFALFLGAVLLLLPLVIMVAAYSSIIASLWHVISLTDLNSLAVVQQSLRNSRESAPRRQPSKISIRFRKIPTTTRTNASCQTCEANHTSQLLTSSSNDRPHQNHRDKKYSLDARHSRQEFCCRRPMWQLAPLKENDAEDDLAGQMGEGVGGLDGGTVDIAGVELGLPGHCANNSAAVDGEGSAQELSDGGGKKDSSPPSRLNCGQPGGACFGRAHEGTEGSHGIRTSCCRRCQSTKCSVAPMSCKSSSFLRCDSFGVACCRCYGGCSSYGSGGCSDDGSGGSGGSEGGGGGRGGKGVCMNSCICGKGEAKARGKKGSDGRRSPSLKRLRSTHLEKSIAAKKHVVRMLFVVVLLFFVCWTPIFIVNILYLFIPQKVYTSLGSFGISFLHLLSYFSSCCNPITYCFMNKKFLQEFRYAFGYCTGKKERMSKLNGTAGSFRSNSQHGYRLALEVKDLREANL